MPQILLKLRKHSASKQIIKEPVIAVYIGAQVSVNVSFAMKMTSLCSCGTYSEAFDSALSKSMVVHSLKSCFRKVLYRGAIVTSTAGLCRVMTDHD